MGVCNTIYNNIIFFILYNYSKKHAQKWFHVISAHVITTCIVNNKVYHIISQIMLIIIIILKTGQYDCTGHVINLPQDCLPSEIDEFIVVRKDSANQHFKEPIIILTGYVNTEVNF